MANYGGQDYTSFRAINTKGSVMVRYGNLDTFQGTVSISGNSLDGNRSWSFPNKNGVFPIAGTFNVQIPAAVAAFFSTIVTVSGITAEDALICQLNAVQGYDFENGTGYVLVSSEPGAGQVTLHFQNLGNATGYIQMSVSYLAMR